MSTEILLTLEESALKPPFKNVCTHSVKFEHFEDHIQKLILYIHSLGGRIKFLGYNTYKIISPPDPVIPGPCCCCNIKNANCAFGDLRGTQSCFDNLREFNEISCYPYQL